MAKFTALDPSIPRWEVRRGTEMLGSPIFGIVSAGACGTVAMMFVEIGCVAGMRLELMVLGG